MERKYNICSNCVMDISDSNIIFDSSGVCEYCNNFNLMIKNSWQKNINNKKLLINLLMTLFTQRRSRCG